MVNFDQIVAGTVALLIFAIIVTLGPTIGGSVENAAPNLSATSDWNATYNSDLPSGASTWQDNVPIASIAFLGLFISILIGAIMKLRKTD